MDRAGEALIHLIRSDPWRLSALRCLRDVAGVEAWIAAGFVRNLVWDRLQGLDAAPLDDVDVLTWWPDDTGREAEIAVEWALHRRLPDVPWSVRNQARMHLRNGDDAYSDLADAMAHWLETATGVAVCLDADGCLQLLAAYGLDDLMGGVLRPTSTGAMRRSQLDERIERKGWLRRWPHVKLENRAAPAYAGQALEITECRD